MNIHELSAVLASITPRCLGCGGECHLPSAMFITAKADAPDPQYDRAFNVSAVLLCASCLKHASGKFSTVEPNGSTLSPKEIAARIHKLCTEHQWTLQCSCKHVLDDAPDHYTAILALTNTRFFVFTFCRQCVVAFQSVCDALGSIYRGLGKRRLTSGRYVYLPSQKTIAPQPPNIGDN